ncbi:hypothetical protein HK405_011383 [Cladochytrium tenue]|nr:hypothetical protein HK405_011383 [Cladochytrium tenue]
MLGSLPVSSVTMTTAATAGAATAQRVSRTALLTVALLAASASAAALPGGGSSNSGSDTGSGTGSDAISTTIDATSNYGTWQGWGVSLAWWAAAFGPQDDLLDALFTTDTVAAFGSSALPGLGLTIVRYNAGACSWNSYQGASMVVSPDMIASRQMHGFWLDWGSSDPTSGSWNWSADPNQVAVMQAAVGRGASTVELFSNSPMWWMCYNHNPSGSDLGIVDNLQSWNYDAHAIYLATVARYAADEWGVTFASVDAFNEPFDPWDGLVGTQEGCHFSYSTQTTVIQNLRNELNARGLSDVAVSASDENTYDEAIVTLALIGDDARADLGRVNVHGYQYGGGSRDGLRDAAAAAGLPVWNSEYGEGDATGAELASNLILDLIWLRPAAWVYWQAVDGGGWGLIDGDNDAQSLASAEQKFFVLATFTRHIRPGMRMLAGGSDYTVAAYDPTARRLVVIAVNWSTSARSITIDLSAFTTAGTDGALVPRWATQIGSGGDQYAAYTDTYLSGSQFTVAFGAQVIMAFEIDNVDV